MSPFPFFDVFAWLLAAVFLVGALGNALQPGHIRQDYARWGYPGWFHWLTALLELATAALLIFPDTRLFGAVLGALVMAGAATTVLRHREFGHAVPPGVLLVLCLLCGWIAA